MVKIPSGQNRSEFIKKCEFCGESFYWPYMRKKIYCGPYCQRKATREREKKKKRDERIAAGIPTDEKEVFSRDMETVKSWNRTVNVLRKHFGLPLFEE